MAAGGDSGGQWMYSPVSLAKLAINPHLNLAAEHQWVGSECPAHNHVESV